MNPVLQLAHITKIYSSQTVLSDISLTLHAGECVALTGANGSGKSTLLRIAAGLTVATKGVVTHEANLRIQYVPDAFPRLVLQQKKLFKVMEQIDCENLVSLSKAYKLDIAWNAPLRTFSKGMLSKISVLQALGAPADLLLLDEPISGLDAKSRELFIQHVQHRMQTGTSVLLACHERELIDVLATRIFLLRDGILMFQDKSSNSVIADSCMQCLCSQCALLSNGKCDGRCVPHA